MLKRLTQQLEQAVPLAEEQAEQAVAELLNEGLADETKADFLCALGKKGETPGEIAVFARELGRKAVVAPIDSQTRSGVILDVCGTGGDRLNTFNISTTVALICAAAGIHVAKHGNRAITSQAGSADVLEELGVPIELTPEAAAKSLREQHFAFFFAPTFHPAFKKLAAVRKMCAARGRRTIFNFLGPLLNPAQPTAQLVGVPAPELCAILAAALQALGVRRGMVVSGRVGDAWLDELSTLGENTIAEFLHERGFAESTLRPGHYPILPAKLEDLRGGDRAANAGIIRGILRNEDRGPKRDAVVLNASAALFVGGKVKSMTEGWALAEELIDGGGAFNKLVELARK